MQKSENHSIYISLNKTKLKSVDKNKNSQTTFFWAHVARNFSTLI